MHFSNLLVRPIRFPAVVESMRGLLLARCQGGIWGNGYDKAAVEAKRRQQQPLPQAQAVRQQIAWAGRQRGF